MQAEVSLVRGLSACRGLTVWGSVLNCARSRKHFELWKWLEREISAPFFFNKFLRNVELVIAFFHVVAPKRAVCL